MILRELTLVVPDSDVAGAGALPVPSTNLEWFQHSDVTLPVHVVHADGTDYNLSGTVAAIMGFKRFSTDSLPYLQREWTITNAETGRANFNFVRGEFCWQDYVATVEFQDDDTDFEDTILESSSVTIKGIVATFSQPITTLPLQVPLAQGQHGFPYPITAWSSTATYSIGNGVTYSQAGFTSLYMSITNYNVGNNPYLNPSDWLVLCSAPSGLISVNTSAVTEIGTAVYVSGAGAVSPTDNLSLQSSRTVGVYEGIVGSILSVTGMPTTLQFTTQGGQPANGAPVYLAAMSDDSGTGAGKLTASESAIEIAGGYVTEVGICLDNSNYSSIKTCLVLWFPKAPVQVVT